MSVPLYMDVNVRRAVTEGLRLRGAEVLTAQEDGTREVDDDVLLDRATALGYVLFTQDEDLLREKPPSVRNAGGRLLASSTHINFT